MGEREGDRYGDGDPAPASGGKTRDRALFDAARAGDRAAFAEIVRRFQPRVYRVACHMLRDRALAEDVTQEVFVRCWRALASFDGRSEPFTWVYRIAVNLSLNTIRSRKNLRKNDPIDDPRFAGVLVETKDSHRDPQGAAARRQLYEALAEAIDGLSETLRTTLILVAIDGRSHEEAAAILGAPEGTIAWRIHEARKKLRKALLEKGFDEGALEAVAGTQGSGP